MKTDQSERESHLAARPEVAQYVYAALVYSLCAWFSYALFETVQHLAALYVPIPVGDYWRVPQHLKAYQTLQLNVFWRQHNEHRIIFPEIVFALDMLWAHGRMLVPTVFSFLCYALTWSVLCFQLLKDHEVPFFYRSCGALVAGVVAFWHGSALALAQPFLLEWTITQLGVVFAVFYLKRAADTERLFHLILTIIAAVIATYSSANALLIWPLLIALGFVARISRRFMALLALSAVVSVGLYFIGYTFSGQTNVLAILKHPFYFIGFAATYLSMPFGKLFSATFSVTVGLLNLGTAIFCCVKAWRMRRVAGSAPFVLLGFYSFTLLTVLITAAGRMDPTDREFTAATATRYLTVPLLNWAALILLSYWTSGRMQWRHSAVARATLIFALLLLIGTYKLKSWEEANEVPFADAQVTAMSIDTGLTDSELIGRIFPSPEFLEMFMPPLKKQHLAMFGRGHDQWLGKTLAHLGVVSDKTMTGQITYMAPVEGGLEVVGWVNSHDVRDPFPRVLLVNELGQAVGWGRRPNAGFPPDWLVNETPEHEAWVAYANLAIPSHTITAYVMLTRRDLIVIPGAKEVPLLQGATRYEVGTPVPGATLHMDKGWAPGGMPATTPWGWRPTATEAYSTWHGRDDNTGEISFDIPPPANGCVAMGVLHGPSKNGLSAQYINADTGAVLANLPFREHDALWSLWKIKVDPSIKHVRFVADDNGKNWGQWIAASGPLHCR